MIAVVALVGCGKKEPVQPSATKPEKETGKKATQPTTPDTEATKAKATAGLQLWEFKTGHWVFPPPPSDLMARFTLGQMTTSSTPSRPSALT
jgi:predicted small lipoprotein YifL